MRGYHCREVMCRRSVQPVTFKQTPALTSARICARRSGLGVACTPPRTGCSDAKKGLSAWPLNVSLSSPCQSQPSATAVRGGPARLRSDAQREAARRV
jgi:hypothetical protein